MKVLELFAGTRSIGKAFEARGHEVFSIEWDKRFENINLYADIMNVTANDIMERSKIPTALCEHIVDICEGGMMTCELG